MIDVEQGRAVELLFADLDGAQLRTGAVKHLGELTILQNPEEYGLTFAFARDLDQEVPVPFERRVGGSLPKGNRVAITASESLDSLGNRVSTRYVFTATRRR